MIETVSTTRPSATYREIRDERGFTLVREDLASALERTERGAANPFDYRFRLLGEIGGGRRPLSRVELEGAGLQAVHKVLRRGGWLGRLLAGRALPSRARREAAVVSALTRASVPCVGLLAIRAESDRLLPWLSRVELLTEPVADAVDLLEYLVTVPPGRSARQRSHVVARAGEVVAAMHAANVFHVDLNLRNLLVTPGGEVLLLDFGASRLGALSLDDRSSNLARLWRSCVKRKLARTFVSRVDAMRFLKGYDAGRAREDWKLAQRRFERTIAFHRLFW